MDEKNENTLNGINLKRQDGIDVFTLCSEESPAIDSWINTVVQTLKVQPNNSSYRVVYDFSNISILRLMTFRFYDIGSLGLTLEGNDAVLRVLNARRDVRVYLGIVLDVSLSAKVSKATANPVTQYKRKFCFNVETALNWLKRAE